MPQHVEAAELHARAEGRPLRDLRQPSAAELNAAHELERRVLETVFDEADTGPPMSVSASAEVESDDPDQPGRPGLGTIDLRPTVPRHGGWGSSDRAFRAAPTERAERRFPIPA